MNVRIIQSKDNELDAPIIWDCFRGSYTHLMCTVSHLIECVVDYEIDDTRLKLSLIFQMYNTNGFQQSTRKVVGNSVFNSEYTVKDIEDETISKHFKKFWDDYIAIEDSKLSDIGRW